MDPAINIRTDVTMTGSLLGRDFSKQGDYSHISHSTKAKLEELIRQEESLKADRKFKEAQQLYTNYLERIMKEPESSRNQFGEEIAVGFNNRGQLKYLCVDFTGAVQDYDEAIKYCPTLPSAYFNRGTISYRMGYFEKALSDMEKAIELSPSQNPEFLLARDRCKMEIGEKPTKDNN